MTAVRLDQTRVHKPWGRRDLPSQFGAVADDEPPVGELIFSHPDYADAELLVKYLFTSEKLSIQVHPDDKAAHRLGQRRGKSEAWYILSAEPGATIAMGPREPISAERLRCAAQDGSLEELVNWIPVEARTALFAPAGTIHAIGGGFALIEVQQNSETTYRLFDYGRPRELHLDQGVEVADRSPLCVAPRMPQADLECTRLVTGPPFELEHWAAQTGAIRLGVEGQAWLIPLQGGAVLDDENLECGDVWVAETGARLVISPQSELLVAYPSGAGSGLRRRAEPV